MRKAIKPCRRAFSFRFLPHDIIMLLLFPPGLLWFRPRIVYENESARRRIRGGALLISNHLGFFDPVYLHYLAWYRRQHFVCLKQFFDGPVWWLFKIFLCIPIDKNNVSVSTFKEIVEHLKSDELVTLFPEGSVEHSSGELAAFKSGMILMALQSKKPIIPVYIHRRKHFYNRLTMCVGEPIDPAALCGGRPTMKAINDAAAALKDKEATLSQLYKH